MVTDATKLLSAVAEGSDDIYEVTRRLCRSILSDPLVTKAVQVRQALADGDDFVVVRAVELAEMVLGSAANVERRVVAKRLMVPESPSVGGNDDV